MTLGWVGTGNMGKRMAERLVRAGHRIYVYNRTKSKAQYVLDAGDAVLLDTPGELAAHCDIVFTSLTDDYALSALLYGEKGMIQNFKPGTTLVEMSTLSPSFSAELREALHRRKLFYLSAPVVGSMYMVESGHCKLLVSGDQEAYTFTQEYLSCIGSVTQLLGSGDESRCLKIAVNLLICSYLTIFGELLIAGEGMGFGWEELNDLLESSDGASPMLRDKGTMHRERIWESGTALTSTAKKDIGLALDVAEQKCFSMPLMALCCQYDRYMDIHPKYSAYSTFGTVAVLEDWCGKRVGDYPKVCKEQKGQLSQALTAALAGVTVLAAAEAMLFCRKSEIDQNCALKYLGNCHGASTYFSRICSGGNDTLTIAEIRAALSTVLQYAKEAGLFTPILATAQALLHQRAAELGAETGLKALISCLPQRTPLAYGPLAKEQFDDEIEKGIDVKVGKVYSAETVEAEMGRDYGI